MYHLNIKIINFIQQISIIGQKIFKQIYLILYKFLIFLILKCKSNFQIKENFLILFENYFNENKNY